jgi:hypothetical protein
MRAQATQLPASLILAERALDASARLGRRQGRGTRAPSCASARTPRAVWSMPGPAAADRMTPATFAMSTTDAAPLAPAFSFFGQGSSEGELCPLLTTSPAFS